MSEKEIEHESPLQRILVATSLGELSDPVMRASLRLRELSGAELHACHAYSLPLAYWAIPSGFVEADPQMLDNARENYTALLGEQVERLGGEVDDFTSLVIDAGAPHRILHQVADRLEPDLIVVGASETPAALRPLLGSTTDRVLRWARCPVLVVRGALELPPRRVLAAIDLSELSAQMLGRGLGLLSGFGEPEERSAAAVFVLTEEERDRGGQFKPEQMERFAKEELERFLKRVDGGLEPRLRIGEPRQELLKEIAVNTPDLVMLGTHGRSGFERWLLGSVASDVVSTAPVSMLVIPPRMAARK